MINVTEVVTMERGQEPFGTGLRGLKCHYGLEPMNNLCNKRFKYGKGLVRLGKAGICRIEKVSSSLELQQKLKSFQSSNIMSRFFWVLIIQLPVALRSKTTLLIGNKILRKHFLQKNCHQWWTATKNIFGGNFFLHCPIFAPF